LVLLLLLLPLYSTVVGGVTICLVCLATRLGLQQVAKVITANLADLKEKRYRANT